MCRVARGSLVARRCVCPAACPIMTCYVVLLWLVARRCCCLVDWRPALCHCCLAGCENLWARFNKLCVLPVAVWRRRVLASSPR